MDSNLKPWLLEVNASPSLTASSAEDYKLKFDLLDDMLTVIDLEKRLTGNETQIGGFDLICKGTPNYDNMPPSLLGNHLKKSLMTFEGTLNDRVKNLRKLNKQNRKTK